MRNNALQVTAAFARIDEQLLRVWPVRSSLFDAFSDAGLAQEIIFSMVAVANLRPPKDYEQEHEILQNTAGTVIEYGREFEQALEDRDLGAVMVAKANFAVSYKRMILSVSPLMCMSLGIVDDADTLCQVWFPEPDSYDARVEQLAKEFRLEFLPRVSSFPLALTSEERFSALAAINKDVEIAAQNAVDRLTALSPPDERSADHAIFLKYLKDTVITSSAITIAGEQRDNAEIERLFARSGVEFRGAESAISCDYTLQILHAFFPNCAS